MSSLWTDDNYLSAATFEARRTAEEDERLQSIDRNWKYYNGKHARPLPVGVGQPNDNVIINLARFLVNKGASFLFGKEPGFELAEGERTPEEEWLDQCWERNRKLTFLNRIAISGGVTGHVFLKIVPAKDRPWPRLVNIEPEYMRVAYEAEDIESVYRYRIQWTEFDRDQHAVERRQDIERQTDDTWTITNLVARGGGRWQVDPENPPVPWPWPFAPVVDCQNLLNPGSYYGLSDLEDLSEQDAINYVASKIQRILRYHAHPKTVGKGFLADQMKVAEDETLVLPSSESDLFNLEMQSDLSAALGFLDKLVNLWMRTERVPNLDPAQVSVGALSGFALKVLYGDLLEKTDVKRASYGDLLIEVNRRLLALNGMGEENYTTIHWPSPLPDDWNEMKARDEFELANLVASVETIRARRGLDNEVESERIAAEQGERDQREGNVGAALVSDFFTNRQREQGGR
ncbi:MAG TPA: phage portal protein [Phycisphaerae bacterium]|nr:phage portal protein [Phycisphaerae bacterium]